MKSWDPNSHLTSRIPHVLCACHQCIHPFCPRLNFELPRPMSILQKLGYWNRHPTYLRGLCQTIFVVSEYRSLSNCTVRLPTDCFSLAAVSPFITSLMAWGLKGSRALGAQGHQMEDLSQLGGISDWSFHHGQPTLDRKLRVFGWYWRGGTQWLWYYVGMGQFVVSYDNGI